MRSALALMNDAIEMQLPLQRQQVVVGGLGRGVDAAAEIGEACRIEHVHVAIAGAARHVETDRRGDGARRGGLSAAVAQGEQCARSCSGEQRGPACQHDISRPISAVGALGKRLLPMMRLRRGLAQVSRL
jgi:hypothetical protein